MAAPAAANTTTTAIAAIAFVLNPERSYGSDSDIIYFKKLRLK
jgi:hypothetical protein